MDHDLDAAISSQLFSPLAAGSVVVSSKIGDRYEYKEPLNRMALLTERNPSKPPF
jgi:hypothetical protein